jgi:hypothetical protein
MAEITPANAIPLSPCHSLFFPLPLSLTPTKMLIRIVDTHNNDELVFPPQNLVRWYLYDTYVNLYFSNSDTVTYYFESRDLASKFNIELCGASIQAKIQRVTLNTCTCNPPEETPETPAALDSEEIAQLRADYRELKDSVENLINDWNSQDPEIRTIRKEELESSFVELKTK